jgi:hypothetical protein
MFMQYFKLPRGHCSGRMLLFLVNLDLRIYLTDFLASIFVGKITENPDSCGGKIWPAAYLYQSRINHTAALALKTKAPSAPPRSRPARLGELAS